MSGRDVKKLKNVNKILKNYGRMSDNEIIILFYTKEDFSNGRY